jgi:hypothetical protein
MILLVSMYSKRPFDKQPSNSDHKDQSLEFHQELIKTNHGPQTNAALQNFKTLLELDISLLMGCDIE